MPLIRRLIERVRRCAARRPLLICTDGLVSYLRAIRETFRDPVHTGKGGRPRLRPWHQILSAQVVKRYERRRVVRDTERRMIAGTPARVETLRRRSQGDGVINTAYIERLNATFRERLAPLARRSRALVRRLLTLQHGMYLMGTVRQFLYAACRVCASPHLGLACAACSAHRPWLPGSRIIAGGVHETVVVSCAAASLDPRPSNVGVPHKSTQMPH